MTRTLSYRMKQLWQCGYGVAALTLSTALLAAQVPIKSLGVNTPCIKDSVRQGSAVPQGDPLPKTGPRASARTRDPHYTLGTLPDSQVNVLRNALCNGRFEDALAIYFGPARDDEFLDWVVYIYQNGDSAKQQVTQHSKAESQTSLRGEKILWAVVFLDRPPRKTDPTKKGADTLEYSDTVEIRLRSENYERDPLGAIAFKTILGKYLSAPDAPSATHADTLKRVSLHCMSEKPDKCLLWAGVVGIALAEDTRAELSLAPRGSDQFGGSIRTVYTKLSNSSRKDFEMGLAMGFAADFKPLRAPRDTTLARLRPNVYFNAYWNRRPPHLPDDRRSYGPFVGMNLIRGSLLDELTVGWAFGRAFGAGDEGVLIGASFLQTTYLGKQRRDPHFFMGIDMRM